MADEFKKDWQEITSLNIVTFKHKLNFVEEIQKERLKATKQR